MMTWNTPYTMCAAALLAVVACDPAVESREGEGDVPMTPQSEENGVLLNSFRLNSFRLNSFRLNSFRLNGDAGSDDYIEMKHIDLTGADKAHSSWISEGTLYVRTTKGKVRGGDDLEGTVLSFTVQENDVQVHREVRIKDVDRVALDDEDDDDDHHHHHGKKHHGWHGSDDAEVTLYDLQIREGGKGKWKPLCVDEQGDTVEAVLLTDIWDPDSGDRVSPRPSGAATFACVDAALGKCVLWGYRPWASVEGVPLMDYHQACTRLVRADYCGEGVSHTTTGTQIHVLDEIGIEVKALDISYEVEAQWGPDGAICLNAANTRLPNQDVACELPACGEGFAAGGLIESGKIEPE